MSVRHCRQEVFLAAGACTKVRWRITVRGQVQGVGFRPFVYRLARQEGLTGFVANDGIGAVIEVQGPAEALEHFVERLLAELPPLAEITHLERQTIQPRAESAFLIEHSRKHGEAEAQVTVDTAVCDECLREMFDPADRRYRYPFINCTNCGPRYTIVRTIPYDRPNTTMAVFEMCDRCRAEYEDPACRRFHAQPIACPDCGPRVWLADPAGREIPCEDPIGQAGRLLQEGRIVAIKGLGGFHLACRADLDDAVLTLRRRKKRDHKPFAMMAADMDRVRQVAVVNDVAERLLLSPVRPIVLLPRRADGLVSRFVAPGCDTYGIMLPYTPLHYLLFERAPSLLVMTSGNLVSEPLAKDNDEAIERLGHLCDAFLLHDRDIERRVDDSVVQIRGEEAMPVRRARGYVPKPIILARSARCRILAVGGELKNTVCLLRDNQAVLSEHLGDLTNSSAYRHFVRAIEHLKRLLEFEPEAIAFDSHPAYLSSEYARKSSILYKIEVQHHFAHAVSCMAEHDIYEPVIAIACDGTGYGDDSAIWGCEILRAERAGFTRLGHLRYFLLPGGDAAAKELLRPALSVLYETVGERAFDDRRVANDADCARIETLRQMLLKRINAVRCSSLGRLFDAVAYLLGVADYNHFEGQGPIALEAAIRPDEEYYPHAILHYGRRFELDWRPTISALLADLEGHLEVGRIAARFHNTVVELLKAAALIARDITDINKVVLSGGCFQNRYLTTRLCDKLRAVGFEVYTHRKVPCNDGGLSLGQAAVAAALLEG